MTFIHFIFEIVSVLAILSAIDGIKTSILSASLPYVKYKTQGSQKFTGLDRTFFGGEIVECNGIYFKYKHHVIKVTPDIERRLSDGYFIKIKEN